jgi:hypothetical protein
MPFNKIFSGTFGSSMTAFNLTNILILTTFFCWVINGMTVPKAIVQEGRKGTKNIQSGFHWLVYIFCFLGIFSVVRGGFYYGSRYLVEFIIPLKRWLTPVFLYFLTLAIVKNREIFKNTAVIIMIVVVVAGLLTIKEGFDLGDVGSLDSSRVGGLAQQPNMMGAFFVYYMFLFLGFLLLNLKNIKSWALLIPFLICLRGIQVTYSRGALMAFAFALTAVTFFKNKTIFLVLCLGMLFALLNPQWLPGGMRYAIDRTSKYEGRSFEEILDMESGPKSEVEIWKGAYEDSLDTSSAVRLEIWRGALQMIKDNPFWGVGYGVFPYAISMYTPGIGEMDAHNTYLIIAAEMGIPVLLVFVLIILFLFRNTFWLYTRIEDKFIKAIALGMLGGIAGMLVANMFGSRMESEEVSAYFWVLAGLMIRAVLMKKRNEIA